MSASLVNRRPRCGGVVPLVERVETPEHDRGAGLADTRIVPRYEGAFVLPANAEASWPAAAVTSPLPDALAGALPDG